MLKLKKYTIIFATAFMIVCACGKDKDRIIGASNSDAPNSAVATIAPEAQSAGFVDVAIDQDVTLKVSFGTKECVIRKISAKKSCKKIVIPKTIKGLPVTSIEYFRQNDDYTTYNIFGVMNNNSDCDEGDSDESWMKSNNKNIKEIVLPDSIKTIADSSFQGLVGMEKIHLPEQLIKLQKYTFARCTKLKRIDLPKNVKDIDISAFDLCHNLRRIHIQRGNKNFVEKNDMIIRKSTKSLFLLSREKSSIVIPRNIKSIEEGAFGFFEPKKVKVSIKNKYIKQKNNCLYMNQDKRLVAVTSNKNNVIRIPEGIKILGKKICCIGYVDRVIIPKSVRYWCEYWYYNMNPEESINDTCIIDIKGKRVPIIKGSRANAISWNRAYRINKNCFKKFNRLFKKYDRALRWSKVYKAYVCI